MTFIKLDKYLGLLLCPILIGEFLLNIDFFDAEVVTEEFPCNVEHLLGIEVHVDGKKFFCIVLGKLQATVVVVCKVETILQLVFAFAASA